LFIPPFANIHHSKSSISNLLKIYMLENQSLTIASHEASSLKIYMLENQSLTID